MKEILKNAKIWGALLMISSILAFISWEVFGEEAHLSIALIFITIVTAIFFGLYFVFVILNLIAITSAKVERKSKQMDETDFEKNKEYYREILEINSPLILGYLDDFEINKNKMIAQILFLKYKKVIDFKDGKIEKINNEEHKQLDVLDEVILRMIGNGKLKMGSNIGLRDRIGKIAEKNGLVKAINNKKGRKIFLLLSIIIGIAIANLFIPIMQIGEAIKAYNSPLEGIVVILLLFYPIVIFFIALCLNIPFDIYMRIRGNLYKRTKKGEELNQKLEGLKNYLKDYSMMDEREAKEIELWEDYLVYSVMFGHNKKVIEEYEKYIEIIE